MFGHDVERLHVGVDTLNGFRKGNVEHVVDAFAVHEKAQLEACVVGGASVEIQFGVGQTNDHLARRDVCTISVPTRVLGVAANRVAI